MLLTAGLVISAGSAAAAGNNPCPSTGNAQYCNEIIFISSTGAVTVATSSGTYDGVTVNISATPYDGVEDQLVGVIDLDTQGTVNNLGLTGTSIAGFDGDGANAGGTACVTTLLIATSYGCNGATNSQDASHGATGYAGFDSTTLNANPAGPGDTPGNDNYFTNFTLGGSSATVNFVGGLTAGNSAWFSLEEPASAGGLGVTANVPEPSSIVLLGSLLLVAAGAWRRRLAS